MVWEGVKASTSHIAEKNAWLQGTLCGWDKNRFVLDTFEQGL